MSDDWILLIPEDPTFIPNAERQSRARQRLSELAPEADEINLVVSDTVEFFHCGVNFERVLCPSCGTEIPDAWWKERMDDDHENGFTLSPYSTPCCGSQHTLHDLKYEWPQGFGRFALEAMNANIGKLDEVRRKELEDVLATELRVIYRHL
jgi:hypothetical protein